MSATQRIYESRYSKYDNGVFDSRWAETEEIKDALTEVNFEQETISAAGVPCISDGRTVYIDTSDNHSMAIGQSGSKKSRNIVFPQTLLHLKAGESMIITDFKGEIYDLTSGYAQKQGYRIYVMNLRDPAHSHRWNPLYEPWRLLHEEHNIDGAHELVNDFLDDVFGEKSNEERYWDDMALRLGMGLCDVLLYCSDKKEATVRSLMYLRNAGLNMDAEGFLVDMTRRLRRDSYTYSNLNSVFTTPERTRTCIVSTFDSKFRLFTAQPNITELFSGSDFDIASFAEEKAILYIITPDEKTTYAPLISNFIHQAYSILISHATSLPGRRLPKRVNFILDEFAQLPYIRDFPSAVTAARSRNIRFTLFIQSMHQLMAIYKDDAETILGNMGNTIFMNSRELPLLERMAQLCGTDKYGNYLISPSRLQRLKNKEKGEALILAGSCYPFITHLADISEYCFNPEEYPAVPLPVRKSKAPLMDINRLDTRFDCLKNPEHYFDQEEELSWEEEGEEDGKEEDENADLLRQLSGLSIKDIELLEAKLREVYGNMEDDNDN